MKPTNEPRRGERGSAFTVALLVLLVLTIAGLAVTTITQTEVRIGANERTTNRSLYASDSGIQVSTARTLWTANNMVLTFYLNTTQQDTGAAAPSTTYSDQVTVTPLTALSNQPCPFCQVNQNQAVKYAYVTHAVNVTANRVGVSGANSTTLASKVVGSFIGLQPWNEANAMVYDKTKPPLH